MEPTRFGKFLLTDLIAAGGMAEIYRAVGVTVGGEQQTLAIKRILPQFSSDAEFISLLIDEAKLMVFLNHPNIVPIIEFGKLEDTYYIAMEYIEGVTLKGLYNRLRDREERFSIDMALRIAREIGNGLAYAHRKTDQSGNPLSIVHRDVSPANILISFEGEVKIADFGISKATNQQHRTQVGVIRGKTGYMSPEQTKPGGDIDHRSDLYALGIMMFEMLTGQRLYQADSVPEALRIIRKGEVPVPSSIRKEIPAALDAVVLKALSVDPKDRYQRGEDLVDAINEFLARFAPGGRAVRVTHTDLMGFLGRHYEEEIAAAEERKPKANSKEEFFPRTPVESQTAIFADGDHQLTGPQTIAANPLFEMSEPDYILPQTSPTQATERSVDAPESTVPDRTVSLSEAPPGAVGFLRQKISPIVLAVTLSALVILSLVIWGVARQFKWGGSKGTLSSAPAELVEIRVESEPNGARIFIDQTDSKGFTPGPIQVPSGKNVTISVRKQGYKESSKIIRPGPGMIPIHFKLTEDQVPKTETAKITIASEPVGAKVFLDNEPVEGKTPVDLKVELHKDIALRLEAVGFKNKETKLRVEDSVATVKTFILVPQEKEKKRKQPIKLEPPSQLGRRAAGANTARLSANTTNPNWAEIYVDGKKVGDAPFIGTTITSGKRKIRMQNKEFNVIPYEVTMTIPPNRDIKCIFDFQTRKGGCKEN